jgi:hypothetical protein
MNCILNARRRLVNMQPVSGLPGCPSMAWSPREIHRGTRLRLLGLGRRNGPPAAFRTTARAVLKPDLYR